MMLFSKKDLQRLIIPLILEQTLVITVGMVNIMMVSSVGEAAVSGVSLVDMLNNLIISVLAALATGGAVVTAQFIGAEKKEQACKSAKQLVVISVIISIVITIFVLIVHKTLLSMLFGNIDEAVMQSAIIYFLISAISYPFLALYNSCAALFRSMGNSKITLKISLLMNIINLVGSAVGILVLHMGVAGVAIPSLVSRAVSAIIIYCLLKNPQNMIYLVKERFRFDGRMIKKILYIGIPSGLENGIFQLGRVMVVSVIAGFGTVQIAANGVANSLDGMGCIAGQAMSLAIISVIGRCVGTGDFDQVKYYTKKLIKMTYIITIVVNTCILLALPYILKIYGLSSETTQLAAILVLIHDGIAMLLWPIAFALPNVLRACNDVKFTMVVSIFSMWTFRIGFSYILGVWLGMGAIGVWIAMILDWIFRAIYFASRYLSGKWQKKCSRA